MRKAIVSGAAGFLGYHLVKELSGRGVAVYALFRPGSVNLTRLRGLENVMLIPCALDRIEQLPDQLLERDFDVFYHLAWQGATGKERQDCQVQASNVLWTLGAVKAAVRLKCRKFAAAGTVCEKQCETIIKKGIWTPSASYLLAKEAAYKMTKMECARQGLPLVWCAFYHPIGKYNKPDQMIASTVCKMLRGEETQFGPANQWFDIIAVEDLCRGFYLAGNNYLKKDWYFIGSGNSRRLRDYLTEIRTLLHADRSLNFSVYPDDGMPMEYEWLDTSSFCRETGFSAKIDFAESVKRLVSWMQEYGNGCD